MPRLLLPAVAALVAWLGQTAASQAVTFLQPDVYELTEGQAVRVHLGEERAGVWSRAAWPTDEVEWLFVRAAGTQHNLHALPPDTPGGDSVTLDAGPAGITVVGLERRTRTVSVPGPELREFLALRVAPDTLPELWREQVPTPTVRVRRIESSKLLVRVRGATPGAPPSATAQSKTGQRVEIRLLADPTLVPLKHDLPLRVYLPGPRPPGTPPRPLVLARNAGSGRSQSFFTDPKGTGFFTITGPGLWTVEVHGARPLADDDEADWEIVTATLGFQVPSRDDRQDGDR